ncbi:hypothetical protein E0485_07880 [Paenibacillus albiflavus]|uniref:Uncharacterized protein n=1 Tax=Paenibacillus albiflavus TaxID=2545760 RepID=A0A4V2WP86_9BACL|nr:hypothetical protein [Paenibacillus albiflavus]TCZ78412.1 hypothetical protein E0485_07880 [Paenibacillus albiflavus]
MNEYRNKYEQLELEEDELIQKIGLCEGSISMIVDYIASNGDKGIHIGESIISAVHTIEKDLQTELLHIRLEKSFMANKMKLLNAENSG